MTIVNIAVNKIDIIIYHHVSWILGQIIFISPFHSLHDKANMFVQLSYARLLFEF